MSITTGSKVRSLPEGYVQLEYIESSGTQYIDTGLAGIDGYTFECDMAFTEWFSTYNYIAGCAEDSSNRIYFTRYNRDGTKKFRYTYNNSSSTEFESPELNERFLMKAVMENTMAQAAHEMEMALTEGMGFDYISSQMDRLSSYADEVLTKTNQMYET